MNDHVGVVRHGAANTVEQIEVTEKTDIALRAAIRGGDEGQYRVGLKLDNGGWVYVLGLTHFEVNENNEFIMHGFNYEGKLASALEISTKEFFK